MSTIKRFTLFPMLIFLVSAVVSCSPPPVINPTLTPTPTPTPTQSPTPTPLNVALDYIGVKSPHPSISVSQNTMQFYVVISDGKTINKFPYPSVGIPGTYFYLEDMDEQIIFTTPSAGDHLSVSIYAYSCEDKEANLAIWKALEGFNPAVKPIREFYESLPQKKELIGWYEHTWYSMENWGITGQTHEEGNGDLKVWFRIWSRSKPQLTPKPRFLPDIRIDSVTLPLNAKPGYWSPITFTVANNENFDIAVNWEAVSSLPQIGKFGSGTVTVSKNSTLPVTYSYLWQAGSRTITYTIFYWYNKAKLDTWSGTMDIKP